MTILHNSFFALLIDVISYDYRILCLALICSFYIICWDLAVQHRNDRISPTWLRTRIHRHQSRASWDGWQLTLYSILWIWYAFAACIHVSATVLIIIHRYPMAVCKSHRMMRKLTRWGIGAVLPWVPLAPSLQERARKHFSEMILDVLAYCFACCPVNFRALPFKIFKHVFFRLAA